jgi:hypothetical protein
VSEPNWSHQSKNQRQTQNETKTSAKLHRATDSGVLGIEPGLAVAPSRQLLQPLPTTNPEHPTHYEPSGSTPEPHPLDPQSQHVDRGRFPPVGRGRLWHGCAVLSGREYGRPEESDLRSFWMLSTNVPPNSVGHFDGLPDIGGMGENSAQSESFFTERTLAAYLAVSDRTIRN